MLIIKQILKKLSNICDSSYTNKKYTIVKFNVSNSCCTSQADNDFIMEMKQLSYTNCITYLFEECKKYLDDEFNCNEEFNEDDKDENYSLELLCEGLKSILDSKRLSIYECECGLDFFIFNEQDEIIVDNLSFHNDDFNIQSHFEF